MKNLNCNQINIFIYLKIIGEKIRTIFFFKSKKKKICFVHLYLFLFIIKALFYLICTLKKLIRIKRVVLSKN